MTGLVIYWIIMWSAILLLVCMSARAGAAERLRKDEKYSFKRLYQNLPDGPRSKASNLDLNLFQICVDTAAFSQLRIRPALHNTSAVNDVNLIRILDGREAMRDDEGGAALAQSL